MTTIFENIDEFKNNLLEYIPADRFFVESDDPDKYQALLYSDDYLFQLQINNNLVNFNIISRRAEPCSNNMYISKIITDSIMTDDTVKTIIKSMIMTSIIPIDKYKDNQKDN